MGQSYRIRTQLGINKAVNVELNQDYEFLEILSLKIQQADIYTRSCADYGVVVGRVTANNGFGIPNAKVAVFIPVSEIDLANEEISSIYPYKTLTQKNDDGYRFNLLPYEKSYSKHAATGTFPSRVDSLTNSTVIELVDKYYKFTVKTNDSGDYMIMGVPIGFQTLLLDVDLSDIGEFSLTPQDLIRMGRATEAQVSGNRFRSSTDLSSLPQIVSLTKTVEVSPLWGEPDICQIAINRVDFDLRDDANIDIQPTSVFMGSIFSTADKMRLRKNCKPRDNMGNLCDLQASPGKILAIRQTIRQGSDGNPILEQYELEKSGGVIDEDGTWLLEIPMNLDYVITNEFGERVISPIPSVGIPTKGKYRFKIQWQQPKDLTIQTRRAYFLVPNVKEYGWNGGSDPTYLSPNSVQSKQQRSSYYFGLDWSGYTEGFSSQQKIDRLNEVISGEDTFYEMDFNRVYTVSSLIDQWKKGNARGRFIGVKEIDDDDCDSTINKFPVNDGVRNFDFLFFLFSIITQILQILGIPLITAYHFIAFIWNNFAIPLLAFLVAFFIRESVQNFIAAGAAGPSFGLIAPFIAKGIINIGVATTIVIFFRRLVKIKFAKIKIPMITYPSCQSCDCTPETTGQDTGGTPVSLLTQFSNPGLYYENLVSKIPGGYSDTDKEVLATVWTQSMAGRSDDKSINVYKTTKSQILRLPDTSDFLGTPMRVGSQASALPMGERINVFNCRKKYFDGLNKISVTFDEPSNAGKKHFDNTLTVVTLVPFQSGTILTFVDPLLKTTDVNFLYSAETGVEIITGISGTSKNINGGPISVLYANPLNQTQGITQQYDLSTGTTLDNYKFPSDVEYYQVITAITISDFFKMSNLSNGSYFPGILNSCSDINWNTQEFLGWGGSSTNVLCTKDFFESFSSQYVTILQRGVDPYSPKYVNKYGLGKLFGFTNEGDVTVTASTKLNIPIQPINSGLAVQSHSNQNDIFYDSYFWLPGNDFSGFTTPNVGYYSSFDANYQTNLANNNVYWNNTLRGVVTSTSNYSWYSTSNPQYYDESEDLSGGSYLWTDLFAAIPKTKMFYFAPSLLPTFTATPLNIVSKTKNIMRTDRLPSSDYMDGSGWDKNAALLQQNLGFAVYQINTDSEDFTIDGYTTGAEIVTADIEGQIYEGEVFRSFSECTNMVSLDCYSGIGYSFGVDVKCKEKDPVQEGCYVLVRRPLLDLFRDFRTWNEWGYRFRFFYGLCRGVLSQIFVNNWINGSLYAFPIQVDVFYDKKNKPTNVKFCRDLIYFNTESNNFYYRSSPYDDLTNRFIGKPSENGAVNKRNLLFPTTIVNLGMKDSVYSELSFGEIDKNFLMSYLNPTSYDDTSDLVNLFVISRITDEGWLARLLSLKDNSINQLFSRPEKRIDGDLAQLLSINSEIGVIKFSPEYYEISNSSTNNPVNVLGSPQKPVICVWFSSTTQDLQYKDFLTPGRLNLRATPTSNATGINYGIKSQVVPFYNWHLKGNTDTFIFGTELNEWATDQGDIKQRRYQSLERISETDYFKAKGLDNDLSIRGYIFNVSGDTETENSLNYTSKGPIFNNEFIVGAPFHFYFGLIQGATSLDKFKTKYGLDE